MRPPIFAAFARIVVAKRTPPLPGVHVSTWSSTENTALAPLTLVAELVICSIRPAPGRFTNVPSGSNPGYAEAAGESSRSISNSGA